MQKPGRSASRLSGSILAIGGGLLSLLSLLSYFLVAPFWPDWRDGGTPNVVGGGVGVALALVGLLRRGKSGLLMRAIGMASFWIGVSCTAFLAVYIYYLSYQLPATDNVLAIGKTAPRLDLPDSTGRVRDLEELSASGKKRVVLVFFRGHW